MKSGIIYLIGKSGTGKYTIAKEIAKAGYTICDNQLINYPVFTLLSYGGLEDIPRFAWNAIATMRRGIFEFLQAETKNNYILTNVLGDIHRDYSIFYQVEELAAERGGFFAPIKLLISEEENVRRIQNPGRLLRQKSIKVTDVSDKNKLINISHPNLLELDVTNLSESEAAERILAHVRAIN